MFMLSCSNNPICWYHCKHRNANLNKRFQRTRKFLKGRQEMILSPVGQGNISLPFVIEPINNN